MLTRTQERGRVMGQHANMEQRNFMTAATHNETGYTLSAACIALKLFNGNYLFADKVIFRRDQVGYLDRGEPVNGREWRWINQSAVIEITVGIYEIP